MAENKLTTYKFLTYSLFVRFNRNLCFPCCFQVLQIWLMTIKSRSRLFLFFFAKTFRLFVNFCFRKFFQGSDLIFFGHFETNLVNDQKKESAVLLADSLG